MCQQLGYDVEYSSIKVHWDKNGIDPWFTKVMCDSKKTNILRCNTIPPNPNELGCSKLYLHCGSDESWNKVPNEGYIGQVLLLHPKNTAPGHQVSFGLVLIYMYRNGYSSWGIITQDPTQPFTLNAANSVCRQMGYTEADHITTAKNSNSHYDPTSLQHNAWLRSIHTSDCMVTSEPCFSCCFSWPTTPLCSVDTCLFEDGIVLKCLFDKSKEDSPIYSEGNEELCQITGYRQPICTGTPTPGTPGTPTPSPPDYEAITISVLAFVSGALLLITIVVIPCCCIIYRKYKVALRVVVNPDQQPLVPNNLN
ncbi:uncharacterized protein LOC135348078 isoform X2 [Halichondria panicea]|uniref:uncharacterized protein LOC135348078 isoform X2 n=1 Tax=Halichondria panicea TaxID=6063 RepID=UPI00312B88F3